MTGLCKSRFPHDDMHFMSVGSFTWTDESPVNYLNWNSGQPTGLGTHGQLEECIEFDRKTGKWNDVTCFTNRGYVCKALKGIQGLSQ